MDHVLVHGFFLVCGVMHKVDWARGEVRPHSGFTRNLTASGEAHLRLHWVPDQPHLRPSLPGKVIASSSSFVVVRRRRRRRRHRLRGRGRERVRFVPIYVWRGRDPIVPPKRRRPRAPAAADRRCDAEPRTSPRRAGLLTSGFTPHLRLHSALTRLRWGAPQASLGVAAASGEVFTVKPQ